VSSYLLIGSRDVFEYGDAAYLYDQAKGLADAGNDVTMFLVQNAVLMARKGVDKSPIPKVLGQKRIKVLADEFCLKERAIGKDAILQGIQVSNVDALVDMLAQDGVKAVWH
jgi:predicted peroxiredoxin